MKQEKSTREERASTVPPEELACWRERISDKTIEYLIDCHYLYVTWKAYDWMRRGEGDGVLLFDDNESLLAALKLARTQLRAKEREAKGKWAVARLRKRAKVVA
jgi:hypothetical protein